MPTKSVSFGGVCTLPDAKPAKERLNCGLLRSSLRLVKANSATLITIGLVGRKLRKREDLRASNVLQQDQVVSAPASQVQPNTSDQLPPPFFWMISNKCNNSQDTLILDIKEEVKETKRFQVKKLLWKKLLKKKTPEIYTIPPELRYQLKEIYVY